MKRVRRFVVVASACFILGVLISRSWTSAEGAEPLPRVRDLPLTLGMTEQEVRKALGDTYHLQGWPPDERRASTALDYSHGFTLFRERTPYGEICFGVDKRLDRISVRVFEATDLTTKQLTQMLTEVLADFSEGGQEITVQSNKKIARQPDNSTITFTSGNRRLKLTVFDYDLAASQRVNLVESIGADY